MKRRYSYKQLSSLWSQGKNSLSTLNLAQSSEKAFLKKAMDEICLEADLAENTTDYTLILCRGMKRLFKLGVPIGLIQGHHLLLGKIFYLGKDLLEGSVRFSQLFYLGMLMDLKMTLKWRDISFFSFIINSIKSILKGVKFISPELKISLIIEFAKESNDLYRQYFSRQHLLT